MRLKKIENKHLLNSLFTPYDFCSKYKNKSKFPPLIVLVFNRDILENFIRYKKCEKIHGFQAWSLSENMAIVLSSIGSAASTTLMEEVFACGGEKVLILGMAGSISSKLLPGDIVICDKALKDEGVSKSYVDEKEIFSFPDFNFTHNLKKIFKENNLRFHSASTWTTDTPYRETQEEVDSYIKFGILTVEMEASAIFSLSKFREKKAAAVFVISDIISKESKKIAFHYKNVFANLSKILDIIYDEFK